MKEYTIKLSRVDFENFIVNLKQTNITTGKISDQDGCAGGTTDRFDIALDDFIIWGYVYHCAGKRYGDLVGDTDKVAGLFRGFVEKVKLGLSITLEA